MIDLSGIPRRFGTWTQFKALVTLKNIPVQYEEDGGAYLIYAFDNQEAAFTTIWTGEVPSSIIDGGYSQATNDSDKSDFVTNYLPTANKGRSPAIKAASTAPVAGDPSMVVVISPNQPTLPVAFAAVGTPGITYGEITTSAVTNVAIRKTAYTEQSSNAQRSVASNNANDTSAGTGARTIRLTYYTATFTGPFTEDITLNGTSNVDTVATNICYIEKIEVVTVGSTGSNVGIISLFAATGGGGGTIGTIAATDNRTLWAHHYVATGLSCYLTSLTGNNTNASNTTLLSLRYKDLSVATSPDRPVADTFTVGGPTTQNQRTYGSPVRLQGPARITAFGAPAGSPTITTRVGFDFYDQ